MTLLVGGADTTVLDLHRDTLEESPEPRRLVSGATLLIGEAGGLDEVGRLAMDWFVERPGGP